MNRNVGYTAIEFRLEESELSSLRPKRNISHATTIFAVVSSWDEAEAVFVRREHFAVQSTKSRPPTISAALEEICDQA
jgi:hypothetical protein